ncbi:MAG TPA: phage portal protein [Rhodocyclaceae bacterium]|nr:phage portal protein [Rhodocyclaceae bacterium]
MTLPTIRNRSRDAVRNEWAAKAATARWASNLVGTGILARPQTTNKRLRLKLAKLWDQWTEECDADDVLDLYGIQTLVAENWIEAGEVFVRLRWRRLEDGLSAPLQLQVLESEMVPLFDADHGPDLPRGHYVRAGIEFNAIGRRVAYWMHREHPGDARVGGGIGLHDLRRVPAQDVLHIYKPQRPGQLRGVSEFAGILPKLRGVGDFDDAVLERQKLANLFAAFITSPPVGGDGAIDPVTGEALETDYSGVPMAGLEPGTSQHLMPGEDVRFSEPPDAGANYGDFMRYQHQHVAAGANLPYELLTGDVRGVSDRTLRVVILEFRRLCQQRQWQILVPQLCRKVRNAWAQACLVAGTLTAAEAAEARRVEWAPQGWDYRHPVQDVDARIKEVRAGLKTRSSAILEKGDDPWQVEQEMYDDNARADKLGLVLDSDPRTIGKGVRVATATKDDTDPSDDEE